MIDLVLVSNTQNDAIRAMTQRCIDSFRKTCIGNVIVVEETDRKYQAKMVRQPYPFNYNRCLNEGAKQSKAQWICFANNDCEFLPGWDKIIEYGYDSVSPLNPGWFKQAGLTGVAEGYEVGIHVCGWCIIVKRSVLNRIGGFPEDVEFWYSDNLYADVLRYYGIKHALITHCQVRHTPSVSLLQSKDLAYLTDGQTGKYEVARKKWVKKPESGNDLLQFVTINHNNAYFDYLGKAHLKNLTVYPSTDSPARVYNEHIRQSTTHYICFIHSDVSVTGLEDTIRRTIELVPEFGALGAVGSWNGTRWSRKGQLWELKTCDSCCIVINRDHGLLFDEKTFFSFHLYIENYCMEIRSKGFRVYTMDCNAYENKAGLVPVEPYFVHLSQTWHQLGSNWGEYNTFKHRLIEKYPNVETT